MYTVDRTKIQFYKCGITSTSILDMTRYSLGGEYSQLWNTV